MYKFAIAGCGRIAARHAENIAKIGSLVAVADIVPKRADLLAATYGAKAYYDIDELLKAEKDIDVISICTPNGFHAEHSIKSLQAGKHVLCEKPLCLSSSAAWQMLETEKYTRKKLFVVKSTRYNPLLKELKRLLENGSLGTLYSFQLSCIWNRPKSYYTEWRGKLFPDGGTLYTQFSHYIDALLWLFGDLQEVKGFSSNKAHSEIEFEDTGVAAVQMESGMQGTILWTVNSFERNHEVALTLIAENGTIRLGGAYMNEVQYQHMKSGDAISGFSGAANDYGFYKGSMSNHQQVYENLVQALDKDEHSFPNAFDGLKTVEAIQKIYKAVESPSYQKL